ncbi:MAG: type I 3-dehydroquinate dehydratase [Chloroflexota bacterium]
MKRKPRICASITTDDPEAIAAVAPLVDLFEVRIDLLGEGWREVAGGLSKPWIACNRCADEGGQWAGTEKERIDRLLKAADLGADIIDIELGTEDLKAAVAAIKEKKKECLISFHSLVGTPSPETLRDIVRSQLEARADIGKVVTTAQAVGDNFTMLQLLGDFPGKRIVAFAMGDLGHISRVFSPLAGADFTYAAVQEGGEAAPGQLTAAALHRLYGMLD